jgi:UDP-N-acetylmuramoyl-tripeptide--D-alanyl-D-alanine ligase
VLVSDTQVALRDYAAHILRKSSVEVIAVTGSAGKTSTKEMIAAVLATRYEVFRNYGATTAGTACQSRSPDWSRSTGSQSWRWPAMASGDPELARITRPRVGVVTNVSQAQIAYFGSLEAIARENGALVEALPADGVAVLNRDDQFVRALAHRSRAHVVDFGLDAGADMRASDIASDLEGTSFRLVTGEGEHQVALKLLGAHQASNALAALAVAVHYEVPLGTAIAALAALTPMSGRLQPLRGLKGSTVLDDTFSASPAPVVAALRFVRDLPRNQVGRRIAVLGDLHDLGHFADDAYREIGAWPRRGWKGSSPSVKAGRASPRRARRGDGCRLSP